MQGKSPEEVFTTFREHINDVLHHTITDAPLTLLLVKSTGRANLEFRRGQDSISVAVGKRYFLYLNQTLEAEKIGKKTFKLHTCAYAYSSSRWSIVDR